MTPQTWLEHSVNRVTVVDDPNEVVVFAVHCLVVEQAASLGHLGSLSIFGSVSLTGGSAALAVHTFF